VAKHLTRGTSLSSICSWKAFHTVAWNSVTKY